MQSLLTTSSSPPALKYVCMTSFTQQVSEKAARWRMTTNEEQAWWRMTTNEEPGKARQVEMASRLTTAGACRGNKASTGPGESSQLETLKVSMVVKHL